MNAPSHTVAHSCTDCPIRHRAVCANCDAAELAELEEIKYYRSFEAGQTIIWSGDKMGFVGSVVAGIATLTQTMEDGTNGNLVKPIPTNHGGMG